MQACADTPTANQSALKGWAWNTNLGWMSFYCGADGKIMEFHAVPFNTAQSLILQPAQFPVLRGAIILVG